MSEISDLSSILQNSLLLYSTNNNNKENQFTLTRLNNGEFGISLKEYTQINTYNTMMTALYGNNSANKFQNTLNILTNSAENELANAKTFVETMQERGMSPKAAVNTLIALQKYSLMSSYGNYNYINANA